MSVLVVVRCGDAFRFLTLASHGGPPFSLALASSVACRPSGGPVGADDRRRRAPTEDEFSLLHLPQTSVTRPSRRSA